MARVTVVKSARKDQGNCESCGYAILVGASYQWVQVDRFSRRRARHLACPTWRESELTSNEKRSTLLAAQEDARDAVGDAESIEDLKSILDTFADAVREVGQMYSDSADAMEEGFGHSTEKSEEQREKGDELENAASDVETAKDDMPDDEPAVWMIRDLDGNDVASFDSEEAANERLAELEADPENDGADYEVECDEEGSDLEDAREKAMEAIDAVEA